MIWIEEREAVKGPGWSSLFIRFNYNEQILSILKQLRIRFYNKLTFEWEVPVSDLKYLIESLSKIDDINVKILKEIKSLSSPMLRIPDGYDFKTKPFNHQLEAIEFGLNKNGWLLLDSMGLGKTLSAIYIAEILKQKGLIDKCLVICGVNGLKWNWKTEIERHSYYSSKILGEKTLKNGSLKIGSINERVLDLKSESDELFTITNIETLRSESIVKTIKDLKGKYGLVIVDEIHKAKNPKSQQGKNLLEISKVIDRKLGMTGTMIMTNPLNAYVPLKFIGDIKSSQSYYNMHYCEYGGYGGYQIIGYKHIDYLQEHISRVSLRRRKEDVLDLPDRTFNIEYVEMDTEQEKFYQELKQGITDELDKLENANPFSLLALTTRLRQATAWPGMLSTTVTSSAKLDRLEDLVEEIIENGHKVLIFSTYKETLKEVEKRFSKYSYVKCDGDTKDSIINENKVKFQEDPTVNIMLATWQKMGTGHTLTAATYVIFIDTPYTDAEFKQAADRAYRIGTTKNVTVITLVTKDTCDERVLASIERRELLSDYLIDNEIDPTKAFDAISFLLS